MPSITIERKSITFHADGSTTVSFTKATYDWPASVIANFRRAYPHVPVTVDMTEYVEPVRRGRGYSYTDAARKARDYGKAHKARKASAADPVVAVEPGYSTADFINEAAKEIV